MNMPSLPAIPTDKSYKFKAIGGAFLWLFGMWSGYTSGDDLRLAQKELAQIQEEIEFQAKIVDSKNLEYDKLSKNRQINNPWIPSKEELQAKKELELAKKMGLDLLARGSKINGQLKGEMSNNISSQIFYIFLSIIGLFFSIQGFNEWRKKE